MGSNEIEDSGKIANEFNKFFVSVAFKIKEPIENSDFGKLKDLCDSSIPEDVQLTIPEISRYKV